MDDQRYRTILSHWAATVSVVAVRDGDRVHGTTVTSFTPVASDPPTVLVSLGPNAQVRPFLEVGSTFVVNVLGEDQTRLAEVYADPFPVGPSPFRPDGPPVIDAALAHLVCTGTRTVDADGNALLVLARVEDGDVRDGARPLLWFRRSTARLANDG
jgi:flavin reductase (DIM6/NTAB) family NADH-FMN oxidoreductase RutF